MHDNYKTRDNFFTNWFFNEQEYISRYNLDACQTAFNAGWKARKELDLAIVGYVEKLTKR